MVGRVSDRTTFRALREHGQRGSCGPISATFCSGEPVQRGEQVRVAYAIGKRVGGAVVRNRLRRRLRAAMHELAHEVEPGAYLVAARPAAGRIPFEELTTALRAALGAASKGTK